jgi:hypothetical protein
MSVITVLLNLINGYKTYASVIMAIVSGIGLVLSKNYTGGLTQILQSLLILFGGASIAGMRHAVAKVEAQIASGKAA